MRGAGAAALAASAACASGAAAQEPTAGTAWDEEVDVLVAGSGASGLMAAVECARAGLAVLVVDCNEEIGGCSALSGGGTALAAPFSLDGEDPGITADEAYAALVDPAKQATKKNNRELCRSYVDNAADAVELLKAAEVPMGLLNGAPGGLAFPADEANPGPGKQSAYLGEGQPATSGSGLVRGLQRALEAAGGRILLGERLVELVMEDGACVGARMETAEGDRRVRAGLGVALCSSGWKGSPLLRRVFDPRITDDILSTGYPYATCDGSATVAALEAGALLASDQANDSGLFRTKYGTPYYNFRPGGQWAPGIAPKADQCESFLYVNPQGARFFDESANTASAAYADAVLSADWAGAADGARGHRAWMVFDEAGAQRYGWDTSEAACDPSCAFTSDTVEGLAAMAGLPAEALAETVGSYNALVDEGGSDPFDKPADKLTERIETPPFHAVSIDLFVHNTCGGLMVDGGCRVVGTDGEPIPGLFAAGDAIGGISLTGLCRAIVTGFIAGASIAGLK